MAARVPVDITGISEEQEKQFCVVDDKNQKNKIKPPWRM